MVTIGSLRIMGSAFVVLSLGACGEGSGGGMASAPPPTPTPTLPTAPTSTYHTTTHASLWIDARLERQPDGTTRVAGIDSVLGAGLPSFGNMEIREPNSYAFEFSGMGGPEFPPAYYVGSDGTFDHYRTTYPSGNIANLDIATNGPGIALTYSSFGNVTYSWGPPDDVELTFFAAGSTILAGQVPQTGTASYEGMADGLWIDGPTVRRLYGSPARLTADFASGQLTTLLELRGHDEPFGDFLATNTTELGTFTGTGTINGSYFDGTYAPSQGYSGHFLGRFFGPGATEAGWGFRLLGTDGQVVTGAAVGKQ